MLIRCAVGVWLNALLGKLQMPTKSYVSSVEMALLQTTSTTYAAWTALMAQQQMRLHEIVMKTLRALCWDLLSIRNALTVGRTFQGHRSRRASASARLAKARTAPIFVSSVLAINHMLIMQVTGELLPNHSACAPASADCCAVVSASASAGVRCFCLLLLPTVVP